MISDVGKVLKVVAVLMIPAFSSCTGGEPVELPMGIWKSESPDIILYIEEVYRTAEGHRFLGIYTANSEETKLFIRPFTPRDAFMQLFPITAVNLESGGIDGMAFLFSGSFHVIDDELHFAGMIFHRLENYTPIDPADWLPYVR